MLVVIPSALYGWVGALLSALIVIFCTIGLTMHVDFYAGIRRRDFYAYYTNLSNLFVLVYFAIAAPRLYAKGTQSVIARAEFIVMMSIMLTFFVFHHLLMPAISASLRSAPRTSELAIVCISNFIVHYIVPWLVFLYWLLCSPNKEDLTIKDAFAWTMIPLLYLFFIFVRAPLKGVIAGTKSAYPYPFLDIRRRGAMRVARTCTLLYGICVLSGLSIIVLIRLLFAFFGGGHALLLI